MDDPAAADAAANPHERLNDALRAYGASYSELAREFAASEGLHSTDAVALIEILSAEDRGAPLSPARLSDRIGLTAGATSTLLNRLEAAGHVVRSRVHTDRRIVTLHSTPNVQEIADTFFDPLGDRIAAVLADYPPELLTQFERLLGDLRTTMEEYILHVGATRQSHADAPGEAAPSP